MQRFTSGGDERIADVTDIGGKLKNSFRKLAIAAAALAGLTFFQNCGGNQKSSPGTVTVASVDYTSDDQSGDDVANSASGTCYQVTCTSLSQNTESLYTRRADDVLRTMAPSGLGAWVILLEGNAVNAAINCFSDETIRRGTTAQLNNQNLCKQYAAGAGTPAPFNTYARGKGNPFESCDVQRVDDSYCP